MNRGNKEKRSQKHGRKKKPAFQLEAVKTGRRKEIRLNAKLLTEAEEQCVHTHGVHAEESVGDEVGSHYHRLGEENNTHQDLCCGIKAQGGTQRINIAASHQYRHPVVVQRWSSLLYRFDSSREEEEREDACTENSEFS